MMFSFFIVVVVIVDAHGLSQSEATTQQKVFKRFLYLPQMKSVKFKNEDPLLCGVLSNHAHKSQGFTYECNDNPSLG